MGRNLTDFVNKRLGTGMLFKTGKYLTVSPVYRYIAAQPLPGKTRIEHRLTFEAEVSLPLGPLTLEDRNRIERRFLDSGPTTNYRNRAKLSYPVKLRNGELEVFISDEVFYDWRTNAWFRNRLAVGGERELNQRFSLEIYYLRQNDSHSHPGDLHVLGATLEVNF